VKSLNLNNVIVSGNLVQDPRITATAGGGVITNMRIAVNNWRKVGEEWKNEPAFVTVVAFKNIGPELKKGVQIVVQGKLAQSNWVAKTGEKRSEIEIIAFNITIPEDSGPAAPAEEYTDDIPF
jgi:single stranded DNA-binding protein